MEVPGTCSEKEASTYLCGPCKGDDISTNADGFCNGCKECMCNDCFRQHIRVKLCKDHVMVDLDSISKLSETTGEKEVRNCITHTGETIKFYCRDHNAVGCGDCMMLCHSSCKSENIIDISKDFDQSETFKALKNKIDQLKTINKRREDEIPKGRASNETKLQKVIEDIKKFRRDLEEHLQQLEDKMIQEAKEIFATNNRLLADVEKVCQRISTELQRMDKMSDAKTYDNKELFVNTVEFKSRFSGLDELMKQTPLQIIFKLNFVANSHLMEMKTLGQFGTLEVTKFEKAIEVGVRVQRIFKNGTVTAVEENGDVLVKWDDEESSRCTIGKNFPLIVFMDTLPLGYMFVRVCDVCDQDGPRWILPGHKIIRSG